MKTLLTERPTKPAPTELARARMLAKGHRPLLLADWDRTLMMHFTIDPEVLRPWVPFPLDLRDGKAYVSLVAFDIRRMRPARGGRLGVWAFKPIGNHGFLNVRTYVRVGNLTGIHFITEYMDNLLSLKLGPLAFGLPYRYATIDYRHDWENGALAGRLTDPKDGATFTYRATLPRAAAFTPPEAGGLTEWLMERYTAFTARKTTRRLFHVWHEPWPTCTADVRIEDDRLLRKHLPWFAHANFAGATFSPGVFDVWMGPPERID